MRIVFKVQVKVIELGWEIRGVAWKLQDALDGSMTAIHFHGHLQKHGALQSLCFVSESANFNCPPLFRL